MIYKTLELGEETPLDKSRVKIESLYSYFNFIPNGKHYFYFIKSGKYFCLSKKYPV
jgi:hypothetical protein